MTDEIEEEPLTPSEIPNSGDNKKKIKKTIIIVTPIVIAIIGALYFFFFVIKAPKHDDVNQIQQSKNKEHVVLEANTYLDIDPITIGLSPSGTTKEYLRIDITLRLYTEDESNDVMIKLTIIKKI